MDLTSYGGGGVPLMARLMVSRRELRLVWEADSVVPLPLFPRKLDIDVTVIVMDRNCIST